MLNGEEPKNRQHLEPHTAPPPHKPSMEVLPQVSKNSFPIFWVLEIKS